MIETEYKRRQIPKCHSIYQQYYQHGNGTTTCCAAGKVDRLNRITAPVLSELCRWINSPPCRIHRLADLTVTTKGTFSVSITGYPSSPCGSCQSSQSKPAWSPRAQKDKFPKRAAAVSALSCARRGPVGPSPPLSEPKLRLGRPEAGRARYSAAPAARHGGRASPPRRDESAFRRSIEAGQGVSTLSKARVSRCHNDSLSRGIGHAHQPPGWSSRHRPCHRARPKKASRPTAASKTGARHTRRELAAVPCAPGQRLAARLSPGSAPGGKM